MANGQQEAIAFLPFRILGPIVHRVEIGHRQDVGDAQRLGNVALALYLAHAERMAADVIGAVRKGHIGQGRL